MATTSAHRSLGGIPPDQFDGKHAQAQRFLTVFKQFTSTDRDATITRNSMRRCAHFLSQIDGPEVKGWIERPYD